MKYLLLYNVDGLSKGIFLKSYLDDGFEIVFDLNNYILIKKDSNNIIDEDIYVKIVYSFLNSSSIIKNSKGKIIDLTSAFKYAESKNGYNKLDNKFDWYIRNTIIKEIINKD
ncbi:MAG: hypothetical protein IKH54_01445 [Bacilli bacterium]|nr:hypothetical protein [Bacilli bacterium]